MAQPVWQTPAGSLGVIPEGIFFQQTLLATDPDLGTVTYSLIAGSLPSGVQLTANGQITGVPQATSSLQGVPTPVNRDVTSKFVIRAQSLARIADRTFTLTVTGNDSPEFVTPAGEIGSYYDGDLVNYQIEYTENDPGDTTTVILVNGELPPGLALSASGLVTGYIEPATPYEQPPGYDNTPSGEEPYDFVVVYQNRNYQFTLEVTDGKTSDLRTFSIFVYARNTLTADTTEITADTTTVTADESNVRAPFLINAAPADLGTVRSDNYYAYQFIGDDYDTEDISYAISVNEGFGLPPGLSLDPSTGWFYGEIPDQGTTEVTYSFNITVYQTQTVQPTVSCTSTSATTNRITCASTAPLVDTTEWYNALTNPDPLNIPIKMSGTALGGLSTAGETLYYVIHVYNATEFDIAASPGSNVAVDLSTSSGSMTASVVVTSQPFPFTLTITGAIDTEITWLTDSDLGTLINGATSLLKVEAVNRGGRELSYKLASGAFNSLPQGLELLPSGDIAGRVTFNTFAIDLGDTTFDNNTTTWDSEYVFTVNAYAPETQQQLYEVNRVQIVNGGSGYSRSSPPTVVFSDPVGASAVRAVAGNVTVGTNAVIINVARSANVATVTTADVHEFLLGALVDVECSIDTFDATAAVISAVTPTTFSYTNSGPTDNSSATGNAYSGTGITSVAVENSGDGYIDVAEVIITQSFGGSGANLVAVMEATGTRDVISVNKEFSVRVIREYDRPYQNLYVQAMPTQEDRALVASLLDNSDIFVPEYIFRPDDPNFGLSSQIIYQHAFGLYPATLDRYVESLYLNHYWKNLTLGAIETAVARDANDNIIYEVVYSRIIDDLVNNEGDSVAKIEPLAYSITDPADGSSVLNVVYPNSLDNMRDQVIDTVGQISTTLPLWMTSKQTDGRVLGFTPAWVICYTNPGRSRQIAYYLDTQFGVQLNRVDFKVDRYILDRALSLNWDAATQDWTPQPSLTTFDRFDTSGYQFIGNVSIATNLAYADVNKRGTAYVDDLGGLDGEVDIVDGTTIVFVKQEDYDGPPGSSYATIDAAWQNYTVTFDSTGFDATGTTFDESVAINGGQELDCTDTNSGTGLITYVNATGSPLVYAGLPLEISDPIGGLAAGLHLVDASPSDTTFSVAKAAIVTTTTVSTDLITISDATGFTVGDPVTFVQTPFGGLVEGVTYYILTLSIIGGGPAATITVSLSPGGVREILSTGSGYCFMRGSAEALTTASGAMTATTFNERMAIYRVSVDSGSVITLEIVRQTAEEDYVAISDGNAFKSAQLYHPASPGTGLTRISWLPLITVTTDETTFDEGSMEFIEPVDMYDPGDSNDKYLVFPKQNILV
jgi:hypothetical protein